MGLIRAALAATLLGASLTAPAPASSSAASDSRATTM